MPPEGLTREQETLLGRVLAEGCLQVRGSSLRVAESLRDRGLIEVRRVGQWKHEAVALTATSGMR